MAAPSDAVAARPPGAVARFWVDWVLVPVAARFPTPTRRLSRFIAACVWSCSARVRRVLDANASRLLGPEAGPRDRRALGRSIIQHHYGFIVDVATSRRASRADFEARITSIEGQENFDQARAEGRGLIVVTAHLGCFEVGMAALRRVVEGVHVVFQRDTFRSFEAARRHLRATLGVHEAAIDDGVQSWIRLRNALERDEVILVQADRAMPGQRSIEVPFLGGTIRLPSGPFRLAGLTGSVVLPVFAPRVEGNKVGIEVSPPIKVDPRDPRPAACMFAQVMEDLVHRYGDQWLRMYPICIEDDPARARADRRHGSSNVTEVGGSVSR